MTPSGAVHPINYQGVVLQADPVVVENVASEVQNVSTVSTVVTTRTGRVVASESRCSSARRLGRALGGARGGGAPVALDDPPGRRGAGGLLGDRRLQPRRAPEKVVAAPAPRLRSARAAHRARLRRGRPGRSRPVRRHGSPTGDRTRPMWATGGPGVVVGRSVDPAGNGVITPGRHGPRRRRPEPGALGRSLGRSTAGDAPQPRRQRRRPRLLGADEHVDCARALHRGRRRAVRPDAGRGRHHRARVSLFIPSSHLSNVANDQIVVRTDGTMAVSEDVSPDGWLGVVTMPGIPLAAAISL